MSVVGHAGQPLDDRDCFAPVPKAVGELISAASTMKKGDVPYLPTQRAWAAGLMGFVLLLPWLFAVWWNGVRDTEVRYGCPLAMAAVGSWLGVFLTRFAHRVSYVGTEGIARYECLGDRDRIVSSQELTFSAARELRVKMTELVQQNVVQGIDFRFEWRDGASTVHLIEGRSPPIAQLTANEDLLWALAAERAWTKWLSSHAPLAEDCALELRLDGGPLMRVGKGFLEMREAEGTTIWKSEDIDRITVDKGTITIRRRDAKEGWLGSSGLFTFQSSELANARFFLEAAGLLAGVRVEGKVA